MKRINITSMFVCCLIGFACANGQSNNRNSLVVQNIKIAASAPDDRDSSYYASLDLHPEVFDLKGGYKLYQYPSADKRKLYTKLVGNQIDTIVMMSYTRSLHGGLYEGMDFDDYFVIPVYSDYRFFAKQTGREIPELEIRQGSGYDLNHNLIIKDSIAYGLTMLVNLKNGKRVNIYDYLPRKSNFMGMGGDWVWKITHVTDNYIYLRYDADKQPTIIKIPRKKLR